MTTTVTHPVGNPDVWVNASATVEDDGFLVVWSSDDGRLMALYDRGSWSSVLVVNELVG